jgi:2-polyprenyl-3-methyl-5-hydroxy-6-metoxy-1,4-benzoquinol methylase
MNASLSRPDERRLPAWEASDLESVPCNICGNPEPHDLLVRVDGLRLVRCSRCGLAYVNRRPRFSVLRALYDSSYFTGEGQCASYVDYVGGDLRAYREKTHLGFIVADRISHFCPLQGARWLDVGCAIGTLLRIARDRGAVVEGIDVSHEAVAFARKHFGLNLHAGTVEEAAERCLSFEVVTLVDVIEHVPDPVGTLRSISRLLQTGGLVLFVTPNFRCYQRYGESWLGLHKSFDHIFYFDRSTLSKAAALAGLEPVYWETLEFVSPVVKTFLMNRKLHQLYDATRRLGSRLPTLYEPVRSLWQWLNRQITPSKVSGNALTSEFGHSLLLILRKR